MIVVGGDNLIDLIQSGQSETAISFEGARGGSAFNTAVAIGRQEQSVGFMTPVSSDSLGDFLASEFTNSAVAMLSERHAAPSSLAVVTLDDGQPAYQFYRQGTAERQINTAHLNDHFPKDAQAFHLASLAIIDGQDADDWADFFNALDGSSVLTTLDPNVRDMLINDREGYLERLMTLFKTVDLLKLSDEDLEWIFPDMDLAAALDKLLTVTDAALVILTMGEKGAIARCGDITVQVPATKVDKIADTVGAGDTFMGTILATLSGDNALSRAAIAAMDSDELTRLLTRAGAAAAINCTRSGCNPPRLAELD